VRIFLRLTFLFVLALFSLWALPGEVLASDAGDVVALRAALDDLEGWIGAGNNGQRWRKLLDSDALRAQIALGAAADPAVVARVSQRYQSGVRGLEKQRFVAVDQQLQVWLRALRAQYAGDLARQAWAARGDHLPLSDERFAAVRGELREAASQLERRLGGNSPLAQGWKAYLKWPLLEPHFSDEVKISGQSLRDAELVLRRLRANQPGLEHAEFVRTADALERYRELAFWHALARNRDTRPFYDNYLLKLEKQITRNLEKPTVEAARQIGKVLGLIDQLGHAAQLVQSVRQAFGQPNLRATLSSTALDRLAQRKVSESEPVRDFILGATVRGTAHSTGMLRLETRTAADHVAVELQLEGNIQTVTSSFKKPVRVGSYGSTDFVATKQVQLSDEQFRALPTAVSARTQTRTRSIQKTGGKFGKRLIEKIARKKVAESKSQAEWISARHAERKVAKKFDRQVLAALDKARKNYDAKLHHPLERLGMFPEHLLMTSSSTGMQVEATLASSQQISTQQLPPAVRDDNDVSVRVHETAINNFLPHLLGGAKLSQAKQSEPPRVEGEVPAWLKKAAQDPKVKENFAEQATESPDFKPWSFLLNREHPASVTLDDEKLTVRIRLAELTTTEEGEDSVLKNWDFLVTYQVAQQGNQVVLRRVGEIEVFPTDFDPAWDKQLTGKQVGVRKNLHENINKRAAEGGGFPAEILLPEIELPEINGQQYTLELQQLVCDQGWLALGYRLP
jgi:hypothetical protein